MTGNTPPPAAAAVCFQGVSLSRGKRRILDDITWHVERGECRAVLGPNGAGKSTLIAVIAGYIWPQEGRVHVLGQLYGTVEIARVRGRIGIVAPSRIPETPWGMTVEEVVASGLFSTTILPPRAETGPSEKNRSAAVVDASGLASHGNRPFGELSTGEKMRALIARALVAGHDLLLLDEPTAGLDLGARTAVIRLLERIQKEPDPPTMIIVSHHLSEMPAVLQGVLLLREGRIVAEGAPEKVLTSDNLSAAYDCRVNVVRHAGHWYAHVDDAEWRL